MVKDRKLVVVPQEAAAVRHIMQSYLKIANLWDRLAEMDRDAWAPSRTSYETV